MVRRLVKKQPFCSTALPFESFSFTAPSLKEIYKSFIQYNVSIFCLQAPEAELFGLIKLKLSYLKWSRGELLVRSLHSMDVILGLDFLLLEIHQ